MQSVVDNTWRTATQRAAAHHSFQVFEVYPWAGLLGGTARGTALSVLDRCRIRTGVVLNVDGGSAQVRYRRLDFDGTAMTLGAPAEETESLEEAQRATLSSDAVSAL